MFFIVTIYTGGTSLMSINYHNGHEIELTIYTGGTSLMSINYHNGCEIEFFHPDIHFRTAAPIEEYTNNIYKIYLGYRQCYSRNPDVENELTDDDKNQLRDAYIKHIAESILADDRFYLAPCYLTAVDGTVVYDLSSDDPELCDREIAGAKLFYINVREYGEQFFYRYLNWCMFIKKHMNHESPIEHGTFSFRLTNVSRSLTHQLVRHRLASYSQLSQRYVGEKGDIDVVLPWKIQDNPEARKVVDEYFKQLPEVISKLKDLGIKNEDIRCVYPNAICTQILVTMNFREIMHFIRMRMDSHAQEEIRHVAHCIWDELNMHIPFVFANLQPKR